MATNQNEEFVQLPHAQQTFIKESSVKIPAVRKQWRPTFTFLIISQWKFKLPQQRKNMSNGNKKHSFCRG